MNQNKTILKDLQNFKKILKYVPEDRKEVGKKLIEELSFLSEVLNKLKETIVEKGVIEHFKQGKQQFMRESPALKSYNITIQRYSLLYKQLTDLLPKAEKADEGTAALMKSMEEMNRRIG